MIFPVIYAVLTWYCAMRWRREWPSFAAVAVSGLFLVMTIRLLDAWQERIPYQWRTGLILLYPYTVLVIGMGVYIACLGRRPAEMQCRKCRYELSGLDLVDLKCPECGQQWRGAGSQFEEKVALIPIPKRPTKRRPEVRAMHHARAHTPPATSITLESDATARRPAE